MEREEENEKEAGNEGMSRPRPGRERAKRSMGDSAMLGGVLPVRGMRRGRGEGPEKIQKGRAGVERNG